MSVRHAARVRRVAGAVLVACTFLVSAFASPAAPSVPPSSTGAPPPVWLAGTDGGVFALGSAPFRGSLGGTHLNQPVIAVAGRPSGKGYWLAALDGGVFAFGNAHFYGSLGSIHLNEPITGMVSTPSGKGYWLVALDGGVFAFGDAHFYGSLGSIHVNQPITGMVSTPNGRGYWLVAADGGVFSLGDADFYGSLGGTGTTAPVTAFAATPNGHGYWLLRRDGRVSHFGNAAALVADTGANALAVGLVPTKSGKGYWIAFADGTVRASGDAPPILLSPVRSGAPIVGIATPWASSSGFALPLLEFLRALPNAPHSPPTSVGVRPFGPGAAWNRPVAQLPIAKNSTTLVAHLWDGSPHPGQLHTYTNGYTYPVYDIADATMTVPVQVTHPSFGSNLVGSTVRWNPAWKPANGSDAQVILLDPATGREWDLWQTSFNGSTLTISNGSLIPGSYWTRTTGFPGSRGAGIPYLAMLVRPQEVAAGVIRHALAMPLGTVSHTFVAPATKSDAGGGVIPMGTRFALKVTDAQIDAWVRSLPLSAIGKRSARVIGVALRDYGMFVVDSGGQATVQLEDVHSAGAAWQLLGLGEQNINGVEYPNQLLNGLVTASRLYAIVPSNQYP